MTTTKAIVILEEGKSAGIRDLPMPKIRDEWMLVKTKALAVNPTDWKHVDHGYGNAGGRSGCDYAGIVEEVGDKVYEFVKGDRVTGFCHGAHRSDHETGAFAEYILVKACAAIKLPDDLSFEQAAVIPVSLFTCAIGLYKSLGLPLPNNPTKETFPILINGGSTITGMMGIQLAKLSGLTVITTASPANFNYVKWLGADAVFDYKSPTCGADINRFTQNKLRYVWDCAGGGEAMGAAALSTTEPSKFGAITRSAKEPLKVNPLIEGPLNVFNYDILYEKWFFFEKVMTPDKDIMEYAVMFKAVFGELLENKALKPIHIDLNRGGNGLEGVMEGMDLLRKGMISCAKLVYTM